MGEFFWRLFDADGFFPRTSCGVWSDELIWLHVGSDLFIWLAYISIPLVLIWFGRRWTLAPLRRLAFLFAAFILSCGFTHFFDALMFSWPVYRAAGLLKLITAIVSWATVIVLIPLVPRVLAALDAGQPRLVPVPETPRPRWHDYGIALFAALLALVARLALQPLLQDRHPYMLPLLAVISVAWACGFAPALFCLTLGFLGSIYLFIEPLGAVILAPLPEQLGLALFFFSGVACAMLGASERFNRSRAAQALAEAVRRRDELEQEVERRRLTEERLRHREADLLTRTAELAASERRAAESLSLYRTLTEAVPQMVWTADAAGTVTYFNRRWTEYTGATLDEVRAPEGRAVVHPEDAERLAAAWSLAVRTRAEHFNCEIRLRRSDGEFRWFLSHAVPLLSESGAVLQWVGTLTDIHDQKQQAETLEQLVQTRTAALRREVEERRRAEERAQAVAVELQRSNSELEAFAYVASHDLQEPLRKIQAFADRLLLKQRDRLDEQGREYLDRILASATRMRRLIDDLLTYSRVTSRARPFEVVDLNVVVRDVLADLEERIAQTDAQVEALSLPTIEADPSQMRQLFQNLLANALKFTAEGTPPRVRVTPEEAPAGRVRICVTDDGIGFDERYLDRIFQVFQRLHGRNEYEGTGVGLAICKKIVDRHGGTITARSEPGRGATFVVELPSSQPRLEESPP